MTTTPESDGGDLGSDAYSEVIACAGHKSVRSRLGFNSHSLYKFSF
jgi:hypothetical protein